MKITKIEIENINSLKGYWCIDFSAPEYKKNHDLFVICGVTGSGKTTILDSITLALYGRTPRQQSFGKQNELMTRRTAKCMARITYECKKGRFSSAFYQTKSREKIDGNLTAAYGIIKNLDTGEESAHLSVTKALPEKTAEIIQLDYDEFCRSILLAQGEFDTFISGNERERAQILAKLNGTEKYKSFAASLWQKANEKIRSFEELKKSLNDIQLMTEEEILSIKQNESEYKTQINKNQKKSLINSQETAWLEKLAELKTKYEKAEQERTAFEKEKSEFQSKEKILESAERAKNCEFNYSQYKTLEQEQNLANQNQKEAKKEFEQSLEQLTQAEQALAQADFENKKIELQLKENNEIWKKTRSIDSALIPVKKSYEDSVARLNDIQEEYTKKSATVDAIEQKIKNLQAENAKLSAYLEQNSQDKKLQELIPLLETDKTILKTQETSLKETNSLLDTAKTDYSIKDDELKKAQTLVENLNEKLKTLVDSEYLAISSMLRKTLASGKACPVCGSKEHPSCTKEDKVKIDDKEEKSEKIALDVAGLNLQLEKAKENHSTCQNNVFALQKNIEHLNSRVKKQEAERTKTLENINKNLSPVCTVKFLAEDKAELLKEVECQILNLREKFLLFSQNEKNFTENSATLLNLNTQKTTINLKDLQQNLNIQTEETKNKESEYTKLSLERKNIFADKDVDTEEKEFFDKLNKTKEVLAKATEDKNRAILNKTSMAERLDSLTKEVDERSKKIKESLEKLESLLKENGFFNLQNLETSLSYKESIKGLQEEKESLKKKENLTFNSLKTCEEELEHCKSQNKSQKTLQLLQEEKEIIEEENQNLNRQIGRIEAQLKENEERKKQYQGRKNEILKQAEEKALWEQVQKFIGKADGSDFEVFVESLAFKRVLQKANKYVFGISGKYTLVQKEGEVDFMIHDENYPDSKDDRPVSNMSGGEKFIISLSLALGIAELASRNVNVDSLFLDEGFGTLSGEPLIQAVDALKALQGSGKMLGIITHIDAVIREFDQKIEAVKKNGGISELRGSGISFAKMQA